MTDGWFVLNSHGELISELDEMETIIPLVCEQAHAYYCRGRYTPLCRTRTDFVAIPRDGIP